MLSNTPPVNPLHARHRHRRQNSTPTAFEGVKIQPLPNNVQRQRALGHRRGLSLDTRRQVMSPNAGTRQDFATHNRSMYCEKRSSNAYKHARAPTSKHISTTNNNNTNNSSNNNFNTNSTCQRFDPSCFDSTPIQFDQFGNQINAIMAKSQHSYSSSLGSSKDFELFGPDSAMSTPSFMNYSDAPNTPQGWISEGDTASTRRSSRRISNGIMDRVSKFETMGADQAQRPTTPPHQNATNYFPPTPMETPHDRQVKHEPMFGRPSRFAEGYDESMEETLKPTKKSNQRTQNIFEELRKQSEQNNMSVPQQPSQPSDGGMYDQVVPTSDFMNMNNFNSEFLKIQTTYNGLPDGISEDFHPSDVSAQSTPHTPFMNFHAAFDNRPDLHHPNMEFTGSPAHSMDMSCRSSPHRRTESLASIASAASIASINIEETKTETGVTTEDIATYIQGPDAVDGKWTCVFEDCGKKFGRKENIKSHVQTHLNDRQYQCPTCKKCFVRQHDLKRHAKIHTGIKPYPCECGNSFARHDALTRHRQRGMCIGAFDGIVKKVVKRGRPRKHRPEMDERVNKSARTRTKNQSTTSVSSQSGYSDSSAVNSPEPDFMMSDDQFEMGGISIERPGLDMPLQITTVSSAPMPSSPPRIHRELTLEPSPAASHNSGYVSPEALMEGPASLPQQPDSPAKSEYNTPPELSQSSSPPPNQFFDAEPNVSGYSDDSLLAGMRGTVGNTSLSSLGLGGEPDDEMLMKAFNGEVQFDRDPGMLMMSKFDEEFNDPVNMFTNDDVYFGSS
ncbi:Metallothionein expression activator [Colletotrichum sidae]|uniref:pH-response transcription factor pacC/RIM101 n=1 Tax=Colletotrichum sidae TaxID=1347389 RepID=A0A4R8TJF4_9PEZI|nr:Metallothionein expression activator [Colletotrichum sidae]